MDVRVSAEQAGTYLQIAHRLRIQGRVPETSERPRSDGKSRRFLDEGPGKAPTLITFAEGDHADVPRLLRAGAIQTWAPPAPEAPRSAAAEPATPKKGGTRGEATE